MVNLIQVSNYLHEHIWEINGTTIMKSLELLVQVAAGRGFTIWLQAEQHLRGDPRAAPPCMTTLEFVAVFSHLFINAAVKCDCSIGRTQTLVASLI